MSGAVFLTGGTGFLGMELIARMLDQENGPEIFVAVRARDRTEARERIDELLARLYDDPPATASRLRPIRAELTEPGLGMTARERRDVTAAVDRVVHCAASISFTLPLREARAINLDGTRRVLDLACEVRDLDRFVHVSTAYVAGRGVERFTELDLGGTEFRNTYEQTKFEAEIAVIAAGDVPLALVRPSIVVGEADSGWTSAFNVLYWPLQAFARGLFPAVPADPSALVDMVPVDYVAEVIERATFTPGEGGTYHAVAADNATTVGQLVQAVCTELGREQPEFSAPGSLPADHPAQVLAPYFDISTRFDNARARLLMQEAGSPPDPLRYLPRLLAFAGMARWGKRHVSREAARRAAKLRSGGPATPEGTTAPPPIHLSGTTQ